MGIRGGVGSDPADGATLGTQIYGREGARERIQIIQLRVDEFVGNLVEL